MHKTNNLASKLIGIGTEYSEEIVDFDEVPDHENASTDQDEKGKKCKKVSLSEETSTKKFQSSEKINAGSITTGMTAN
ncbi:hypothetical protein BpHYR1_005521 [Brachionus plicatilis]|uniref:Uncharacterized protein n=1 Tax=Brachionus plicatilis TaxID=10195 RepID=A0A3M7SE05_BRAPC|nr:hypothetical protein BpHYR1_005521 [Brachionus plicatilis]